MLAALPFATIECRWVTQSLWWPSHFPSKLWKDTDDQNQGATRIARYIREAEEKVGHERTVVMGDFNMDPFEPGVVGSEGLHGTMDRSIASRGTRVVAEESRTFFYNPMWSFFGDTDRHRRARISEIRVKRSISSGIFSIRCWSDHPCYNFWIGMQLGLLQKSEV